MDWTANVLALGVFILCTGTLGLALLWRTTTWQTHTADQLTNWEGLRIGSAAMPLSAHFGDQDAEITFGGKTTFLIFAGSNCEPCKELVRVVSAHPATRFMRKVIVSDDDSVPLPPGLGCSWESYRFHNEKKSRTDWRAPVSPYFYVVDESVRIAAKGVANRPEHLDRLLQLPPTTLNSSTLSPLAGRNVA